MQERTESIAPEQGATRREFVTRSGAIVLGGVAAATMPQRAMGYFAGGDDEIKIALIGAGSRGSDATLQALQTIGKTRLWAVADAFSANAERSLRKITRGLTNAQKKSPREGAEPTIDVTPDRVFSGLDAYQKAIDSGVDLVILASPPGFRPKHFEAAIQAGKHVFMEKPVAVDAPGVRRVLEASDLADVKGLSVGVGLQRRHSPNYTETVSRLQEGAIGDVLCTRAYWNGAGVWVRSRADFIQTHGHEPTLMEYQVNNWYYFNWLCGDHIVEQHIHNIDVCNWIKQAHPVWAQGSGGREYRKGKDHGEIFDHHTVEFRYEDGSVMLSQCRHIPGCWNQVDEYAIGASGHAHVGGAKIDSAGGTWQYAGEPINPYQQEHDDLFRTIREGSRYNEAPYGAESTMTCILGRMATYSGQPVKWDDALASDLDLSPETYEWDATPPVTPGDNGLYVAAVPGTTKAL